MRYIQKDQEPHSFAQWKAMANENWQPDWDNLQNPEKNQLKGALLSEQHYLCCYCCGRIEIGPHCHIEHLKPRELFEANELDFNNLLACCMGETEDPPPDHKHCGHYKRNWYDENLFLSPLTQKAERAFAYIASGEISAIGDISTALPAEQTINHLNLNCKNLIARRHAAISAVMDILVDINEQEREMLKKGFNTPDSDNKLTEFSPALTYIIDNY